ncbi:MAG: hypothetical protein JOY66_19895, partial [Acetobacteraceae bacterium]|nr:hypothetical protein [Acetobacteraceae bacterium]
MDVDERARHHAAPLWKTAAYGGVEEPSLPTILALLAAFAAIWTTYFAIA